MGPFEPEYPLEAFDAEALVDQLVLGDFLIQRVEAFPLGLAEWRQGQQGEAIRRRWPRGVRG